jgi:hypothetical protein
MTSVTKPGNSWKIISPGVKAHGEVMPETIGSSSTLFFGFCGQAHRGEISRPTTATGRIPIGDSADGETGEYGRNFLKSLLMNRTLNG